MHIISCIDDITKNHPYAGVVIVGDFNRLRDTPLRAYPLKQIVTGTTRGDALLDKIYTNIAEWYDPPAILPQIGRSDHNAVLMRPSGTGPTMSSPTKCRMALRYFCAQLSKMVMLN